MKIDPRVLDFDDEDGPELDLPSFEPKHKKMIESDTEYVPTPKRDSDKARRLRKLARAAKEAPLTEPQEDK